MTRTLPKSEGLYMQTHSLNMYAQLSCVAREPYTHSIQWNIYKNSSLV